MRLRVFRGRLIPSDRVRGILRGPGPRQNRATFTSCRVLLSASLKEPAEPNQRAGNVSAIDPRPPSAKSHR